ncbi:hypothetical protein [Brasilonema sp. UFV-L1]|uniref:hypothetical protein n=1 Tax=Brasilonema sp. UFV-L1 TaxID=2234130 RepID=UPI001B7CF21D|nr:hypothetical protein [Brasilonema sp. UFV-L1]
MRKVLIIDTSLLCVWLKVSGMEVCGSDDNKWNFERVERKIEEEITKLTTLVLPLATVVETGNHIAQARAKQYETAQDLAKIITYAAEETSPWAAFSEQIILWEAEALKELAEQFPNLAKQKTSIKIIRKGENPCLLKRG